MAQVIEHFFCSECKQETTQCTECQRGLCTQCCSIWARVETISDDALEANIFDTEYHLLQFHNDPYIGPLNKEDQEYYDELILWSQILNKEQDYRQEQRGEEWAVEESACIECGGWGATEGMSEMCADCFWEEDTRRKQERRNNTEWRFTRMIEFGEVVQGKSKMEAYEFACERFKEQGLVVPF